MTLTGTGFGTDAGSGVKLANSDLHTSTYIYTGTVSAIADTEITAQFANVAAGEYQLFVEIAGQGFAKPSNNNKDDVTVALVASTTGTLSSYAGGNALVITGFGFATDT